MLTTVERQNEFSDVTVALLEQEYNVFKIYQMAIANLEARGFKGKMIEFTNDHRKHINDISKLLIKHRVKFEPSLGRIMAAEINITNSYNRVLKRSDLWADSISIFQRALEDEEKHKKWLENRL